MPRLTARIALVIAMAIPLHPASSQAQTLDPAKQSPTVLMQGPADGVAYHALRERARALVAARKDAEAEPLLKQIARDYPRDGINWVRLASVEKRLGKWREAAEAYERAGPLVGWTSWYTPRLNAAASRLAAGDKAGALALLRKEIRSDRSLHRQSLYDDADYAALRDDPEFRALVGRPDTKGWSRNDGWRRDVDYLYAEVARTSQDYAGRLLPAAFTRRYEQLKRDVPRLSDEAIFVGMNRMLAVLHQGHTSLFRPTGSRYLPIQLYAFPEGLFIIHASDAHAALVGSRVLAFGSMPTDTVLRRLGETRSVDGDMQHLWLTSELAATYHLKGIGAITRVDTVPVSVQDARGETRTVALATMSEAPPRRQDKLVAPRSVPAPLFLRDLTQNHWEQALPEHDAMYVQFNNVLDDGNETLPAFGKRLWTVLSANPPANLILDLRHNNGGNTGLYPELLRTVIAFSRTPGHRIYALIGRRTYSATANFITDLERLATPIWVGEASSECCNFHGDASHVVLPFSRIEGEISTVRWNLSQNVFDGRREMSPDVPVQLTAGAYFAGRDLALEAVFRLIQESRASR